MKLRVIIVIAALTVAMQILGCALFFLAQPSSNPNNAATVNNIVQLVSSNWDSLREDNLPNGKYVVLSRSGEVLYRTQTGLSENIFEAVNHYDTIMDAEVAGEIVGKVIIYNDSAVALSAARQPAINIFIVSLIAQISLLVCYMLYLYFYVTRPFARLKSFATKVACGDLNAPLQMDKHNIFGAFTESFDIMREELKKAKAAEAAANESKKELIAKLSHDIKTPIASIKATAEVGYAATSNDKFRLINDKSDQVNELVTNLFSATLEELKQLSTNAIDYPSQELTNMLRLSDYQNFATIDIVPPCLLSFDKLRLQQVFDNIISNSYKYANTKIDISFTLSTDSLAVAIKDYGGGVENSELDTLTNKFIRGKNSVGKSGAGLGLYISSYLMQAMSGDVVVENKNSGLAATVYICLSGKKI